MTPPPNVNAALGGVAERDTDRDSRRQSHPSRNANSAQRMESSLANSVPRSLVDEERECGDVRKMARATGDAFGYEWDGEKNVSDAIGRIVHSVFPT